MPKICRIGKYVIFFWSNEGEEPIHVHVAQGVPCKDATKIWLAGFPRLEHNKSKIPPRDLNIIMQWLAVNKKIVEKKWNQHFSSQYPNNKD